jgi:hypothetical protein
MLKSAIQGLAIFFGMQFVMNQFMGKKGAPATTVTDQSGQVISVPANTGEIPPFHARPDSLAEDAVYNAIPQRVAPMWPLDTPLDITIVLSPTFVSEPLAKTLKQSRVVEETGFRFGDYNENRVIDTEFAVPKEVQNNGTLWAHFYVGITGSKLDPATAGYDPSQAYHFVHPLTQYIVQKKIKKTKNLLAASDETEEVIPELRCNGMSLTRSRKKRRSRLDQSSPLITIPTSPYLSSRIPESCNSRLFNLPSDNTYTWKQPEQETQLAKMAGIIQSSSSTPSGNSELT